MVKYSNRRPRFTCSSRFVVLGAATSPLCGTTVSQAGELVRCIAVHPTRWHGRLPANLPNRQRNQNSGSTSRRHHAQSPLCSKAAMSIPHPSHPESQLHSQVNGAASSLRAFHNCAHHPISSVDRPTSATPASISVGRQAISAFTSFALTRYVKIRGSKF
jgi:hypothetical protein